MDKTIHKKHFGFLYSVFFLAVLLACSDNSLGPHHRYSLWWTETGVLPDTLRYGDTVKFTLTVGDSDRGGVNLSITGIPKTQYQTVRRTDSVDLILTLVGDSLLYDSLYNISVNAKGVGTADSLSRSYSIMVVDPNRLGGFRKLIVGMWWREVKRDTLITAKDSANVSKKETKIFEFDSYNEVKKAWEDKGTWFYQIRTNDTMTNGDSVSQEEYILEHSANAIYFRIPVNNFIVDTLDFKVLSLPIINETWDVGKLSFDTSLRVAFDTTRPKVTVPVQFKGKLKAIGTIKGKATSDFAAKSRNCFSIERNSDFNLGMISDTIIVFPLNDTLLARGDTIASSLETTNSNECFSADLGVGFWSREVKIKTDTNYLDTTITRKTTNGYQFLKSMYDPRIGQIGP